MFHKKSFFVFSRRYFVVVLSGVSRHNAHRVEILAPANPEGNGRSASTYPGVAVDSV